MLQKTFIHLPGVGAHSERLLWQAGINSWAEFLSCPRERLPSGVGARVSRNDLVDSLRNYQQECWDWFNRRLSNTEKWRALPDLGSRAVYVDIETDGGMGPESITLIGAYAGTECRFFVKGRNLDQAGPFLEQFPMVVTFNGICFDFPVIRSRFPHVVFNHIHLDLMYPFRKLGLRGGLKKIERDLGIARSAETAGMDGMQAVYLWHQHLAGSSEALDLLLAYNREDVVNLSSLAATCFVMMIKAMEMGPERG